MELIARTMKFLTILFLFYLKGTKRHYFISILFKRHRLLEIYTSFLNLTKHFPHSGIKKFTTIHLNILILFYLKFQHFSLYSFDSLSFCQALYSAVFLFRLVESNKSLIVVIMETIHIFSIVRYLLKKLFRMSV